jgi:hypothetical protein
MVIFFSSFMQIHEFILLGLDWFETVNVVYKFYKFSDCKNQNSTNILFTFTSSTCLSFERAAMKKVVGIFGKLETRIPKETRRWFPGELDRRSPGDRLRRSPRDLCPLLDIAVI